jgi:diphthamide synthase (EF-2-diphthine--ammonia ligase)
MAVKKVLLSWSSGKDSAWALQLLRQRADVEVVALLTSFNDAFQRVAMHAVRRELVEAQAQRTGLPLWEAKLPWPCSNEQYEGVMAEVCRRALAAGIEQVAFGDLFLRDIREYRERQMQGTGWDLPTGPLAAEMIAAGVKAKLTCVDPRKLDRSYAGRDFDGALVAGLPAGIDPCGENGEFHTFVYESPVFSAPLAVTVGEVVERDGFCFADVLPG